MKLIAMKCPCCNGELNVDSDREFCFCQYCGTKIMIDDEIKKAKGMALTSRTLEVDNLLKRAKRFESTGSEDIALEYYDKVLDVDADNEEAIEGIHRITTTVTEPNLFVKYENTGTWASKYDLYVDGVHYGKMRVGDSKCFVCATGDPHRIKIKIDEVEIDAVFAPSTKYEEGRLTLGIWGNKGIQAVGEGGVIVLTKEKCMNQFPREGPQMYKHNEQEKKPMGCLWKILIGFFILCLIVALTN